MKLDRIYVDRHLSRLNMSVIKSSAVEWRVLIAVEEFGLDEFRKASSRQSTQNTESMFLIRQLRDCENMHLPLPEDGAAPQ